eukprot:8604162-Pyramimonas_sp.AAC.1
MTWKGEMPHDLVTEFDLVATNTFFKGQWGQSTRFFASRKEPKQIDFMLVQRDSLRKIHCQARFSDAPESDHLPLLLRCHAGDAVAIVQGDV